jgi:hypothetical protein
LSSVDDSIVTFIEQSVESWIAFFQSLIRERSVFEREHAVVDLVAERLRAGGVSVARVAHERARLEELPDACRPFSDVPGRASCRRK